MQIIADIKGDLTIYVTCSHDELAGVNSRLPVFSRLQRLTHTKRNQRVLFKDDAEAIERRQGMNIAYL